MNKVCKYCMKNNPIHCVSTSPNLGMIITEFVHQGTLLVRTEEHSDINDGGQYLTKINYCPICGRKVGQEN